MRQTRVFSSVLAGLLVLTLFFSAQVTTAGGFDMSSVTWDATISDPYVNESETTDGTVQKKKGNSFARALSAPFRAIGRLFGGGKKNEDKNNQLARRISDKEAAKFEGTKITRVKDATVSISSEPQQAKSVSAAEFESHLQKGRALLLSGNINGAINELTAAASIQPKSAEVNKLLGIAYENMGLRDDALKSLEAAVKSDDDNAEHLNNLGFLLYKNGDYERAMKYLKRAAKKSPKDARIWNNLALAQCQRGKFDDAYVSFVKAVGEYDGHLNIAAQLQSRGYAKDAIKHLELAQSLKPNSVDALTKLASLYEMTGRPTDAEKARRTLVALKTFADANK